MFKTISVGLIIFSSQLIISMNINSRAIACCGRLSVSHNSSFIARLPEPVQKKLAHYVGSYWAARRGSITLPELRNLYGTTFQDHFIAQVFKYKNKNRVFINNLTDRKIFLMFSLPSWAPYTQIEVPSFLNPHKVCCLNISKQDRALRYFEMFDYRGRNFARYFTSMRLPIAQGGATINIVEKNVRPHVVKDPFEVDGDLMFSRLFRIHNCSTKSITAVIKDQTPCACTRVIEPGQAVDLALSFVFKFLNEYTDVFQMIINGHCTNLLYGQLPPFNHGATDVFVRSYGNEFEVDCRQ